MNNTFYSANRECLSLLFADRDNEIWGLIENALVNSDAAWAYSPGYIGRLIESYITVSELMGEELPYSDVKGFFCDWNPDGEKLYAEFTALRSGEKYAGDDLTFLLRHTEGEICRLITNVLANDPDDPHYSAVFAANMIKCYIDISEQTGKILSFGNVFEFFITHGFSQKQYECFELSRKDEAPTYRGVQY